MNINSFSHNAKNSDPGCLALVFWTAGLIFVSVLVKGWVIVLLWQWFVVPVFEAAPTLTIVQAIGLGIFISFFGNPQNPDTSENKSYKVLFLTAYAKAVFYPLGTALLGLLVTAFLG